MVDSQNVPEADEPLDPAFEKVRQKMVRLLAVSIGVMIAGVLAVLAAVVWRINDTTAQRQFSIALPADASVEQMVIDDGRIGFLTVSPDGIRELVIYDGSDGTIVSRSPVTSDLPALGAVPE